jgi:hypothetical protein
MPPPIYSEIPDELREALTLILRILMANGNNFMEGAALADGRLFKVRITIQEVFE